MLWAESKELDSVEFPMVWVSAETGRKIYIAYRRMIFTWRLTCGFVEDYLEPYKLESNPWVLDICCGENVFALERMRDIVLQLIDKNPRDDPFKDIPPWSKIKPYYNDGEFVAKIYLQLFK